MNDSQTAGPIEAAVMADLDRGTATGPFDAALAALALRLAQEVDREPTASLAQRLRETLASLAEGRQSAAGAELERFVASLSAPLEGPSS